MSGENGVVRFGLGQVVDVDGVPFQIEQLRRWKMVLKPLPKYRQFGNVMEVDQDEAQAAADRGMSWAQDKISELDEKLQEIGGFVEQALEIDGEGHKQWALVRIAEVLDFNMGIEVDDGVAP